MVQMMGGKAALLRAMYLVPWDFFCSHKKNAKANHCPLLTRQQYKLMLLIWQQASNYNKNCTV